MYIVIYDFTCMNMFVKTALNFSNGLAFKETIVWVKKLQSDETDAVRKWQSKDAPEQQ